ncbi:Hypothetical protein CpPA02_0586 [Corynebacterium pseudotuberculosis]|nr:Hypothetical protein CpPA02_0586 [Corynebacterium pseudotuberculosis]AQL50725.1 hypothetical protein CpPA04_0619 [Corynebacterium pseudotuberculosis]ATQ64943.1 Hypothetical protein CpPA07_0629 [Corynebacterium pseudotuberculosis]AUY57191.1 Hypothetical protein CpCAP3W_02022 [Corynebacterium pseudotuberculosis]
MSLSFFVAGKMMANLGEICLWEGEIAEIKLAKTCGCVINKICKILTASNLGVEL